MKVIPNIRTVISCWLYPLAGLLIWNGAIAQQAIVISSTGVSPSIALDWPAYPHAAGYNIFRKDPTAASYPTTPLNTHPIKPAGTCLEIRSLLIRGTDSANWKLVAQGLAETTLFNPCQVNKPGLNDTLAQRLAILSKNNLSIAEVVGTGYEDKSVTAMGKYLYEIVALDAGGNSLGIVASNLAVTAGMAVTLPAPAGIVTEAGDAMVQVRWNAVPGAGGYEVMRAGSISGPFQRVNASAFIANETHHLNGDTLIPSSLGYVDFQVYDSLGKPITHPVAGMNIGGPANGTPYYYRIRALDFLQRPGNSSHVSGPATPKDTTKPAAAGNLSTTVDNIHGYVKVSWTQVVQDVKGRWEQPDSSVSYRLYRFTNDTSPVNQTPALVAIVGPAKGLITQQRTDTYHGLRAPYGNRTWWYRLRAVDASGNISAWSAAVSAIVKDTTPPAIVKGLLTLGFPDHISLNWQLNTEPDMASYRVYRSLCHLGAWVNCDRPDTCRSWYGASNPAGISNGDFEPGRKGYPCPCSGAFVYLGSITQDSAKRAHADGHYLYNDFTVPPGSPLCYAYWIKAKDSSGNESGSFPIPSPAELAQIQCVHLRDTTPPEPAVISGLNALPNSIVVQWIGPPSQDIRAYHVYRAAGTVPGQEPPVSSFAWVGGMTVEIPPKQPQVLTAPYTPPNVLPCDSIPVQAMPWMSAGLFIDKRVAPKITYWYRVVGIDYAGNQTPLSRAAPVSTFTFTLALPPTPALDTLLANGIPCAVQLKWTSSVNPAAQLGVVVYRSSAATGVYAPIVTAPVKGNSFSDEQVVHGQTYYYKIAMLLKTGQLSPLSPEKSITP